MRVVNSKTVQVTPRKPPFKKSASNGRLYITVDMLRALMPKGTLLHAANELGICVSTLKKACRQLGINGWKTKSRKKKAQTGVNASKSNRFPREYNGTNDNQQQPVSSFATRHGDAPHQYNGPDINHQDVSSDTTDSSICDVFDYSLIYNSLPNLDAYSTQQPQKPTVKGPEQQSPASNGQKDVDVDVFFADPSQVLGS